MKLVRFVICLLIGLVGTFGNARADAPSGRVQVMIVGVDHLVSARDVNNSKKFDPLTPERQAQIIDAMQRIAKFKPTKIMVEDTYGNPRLPDRYAAYRKGAFTLGANEVYQFGFRLAEMVNAPTVYPIDMQGFPFDYPGLIASAKKNGQTATFDAANAFTKPVFQKSDDVSYSGTILETLRFLNGPLFQKTSASWYLYIDGIGGGKDYAGADLVSFWYARNLHIFANIRRDIDSPNDRVVVFMGAGHAPLLRSFVELSPDMQLVDPEPYLQ